MSTKTHLVKQEETIKESGVQVRTSDPPSPFVDQVWINKTTDQIKYFDGTTIKVLGGSSSSSSASVNVWGDLERRLSDEELNINTMPYLNHIVDDFNDESLGYHNNTIKASSGLRLAGSFLTGDYTRKRKTGTLAKKVNAIAHFFLQAIAPKPVAASPNSTATLVTYEYDGDLTDYFKVGEKIIVAEYDVSEGSPVYVPIIHNDLVSLFNIQNVSYDSINNKTIVTYDNQNALDMSAGITNPNDYPTKLMHIPFYDRVNVRANALASYQVMQLKEIHNTKQVCFPSSNKNTLFNQAGLVGDIYEIDTEINGNYGVIVALEAQNDGSVNRYRTHFWYTKDAQSLNPTWTKYSYVFYPGYTGGIDSRSVEYEVVYYDNTPSVCPPSLSIKLHSSGKCIMITSTSGTNGWSEVWAFYSNLSDPTPTINLLPQTGTNMTGTSGLVRGPAASPDETLYCQVSTDSNFEFIIITLIRNQTNYFYHRQHAYEWTSTNPVSINANEVGNCFFAYTFIVGTGTNQKIYSLVRLSITGEHRLIIWTRVGSNLPFHNLTALSIMSDDWRIIAIKETQDKVIFLRQEHNGSRIDVGYFDKNTESIVWGNTGIIPSGAWTLSTDYAASFLGGCVRISDGGTQYYTALRNITRRMIVNPSNNNRVITVFPYLQKDTGVASKLMCLEVENITNVKYNNMNNVSSNDRIFFINSSAKQRLVQGVVSTGQPIATVFPLLSRVGDFKKNQYKVKLRLLGAKVDNSPDENNIIDTSIDEYDICDLPVRDTPNIGGNYSDFFPFSFANKITIPSGQIFYVEVFTDAPVDAISYLAWGMNNTNPLSTTGSWYYDGTAWTQPNGAQEAGSGKDACFFITGEFVRIVSHTDTLGISNKTGVEANCIVPIFNLTEDANTFEVVWRRNRSIGFNSSRIHGGIEYKREITFATSSNSCFTLGQIMMLSQKEEDTEEGLTFNVAFGHPECANRVKLTNAQTGRYNFDRSPMSNPCVTDTTTASDYIVDTTSPTGYSLVFSSGKRLIYRRTRSNGNQTGFSSTILGHNGTNKIYDNDKYVEVAVYVPSTITSNMLIFGQHDHTNGGWSLYLTSDGKLTSFLNGQGFSGNVWFKDQNLFPLAQWVTIKLLYRSETRDFELYYDNTQITNFSVSNVPTGQTTIGNNFSVGARTDGGDQFLGRMAYVKFVEGKIGSISNIKYQGFKAQLSEAFNLPLDKKRYLQLLIGSHEQGNDELSFKKIMSISQIENKSLVKSYSIMARYDELTLLQAGQEMDVKIEMNRAGARMNNSIQGFSVEFKN